MMQQDLERWLDTSRALREMRPAARHPGLAAWYNGKSWLVCAGGIWAYSVRGCLAVGRITREAACRWFRLAAKDVATRANSDI